MAEELVSKLRSALLHHQVSLDPLPESPIHPEDDLNDPTVSYISSMLLDDDEDDPDPVVAANESFDSYQKLMAELSSLVSAGQDSMISTTITRQQQQNSSPESDFLLAQLMDCARAVAANRGPDVYRLAREIRGLIMDFSPGSTMSTKNRTTLSFVDALVARFSGFGPQVYKAMVASIAERESVHVRLLNLPYFRVTQCFANCSIFERCSDSDRIHIVDYGISYGCQWPMLIKKLSERSRGPPRMKITGIDFLKIDLKQVGRSLVEFASGYGVSLEFDAISSSSWELAQPKLYVDELLIINCNLRLRHLPEDGSVFNNPRNLLFDKFYKLRPAMMTICVLHANTNMSSPFFLQRFEESLPYFFNKMEFFEALMPGKPEEFALLENIVAKAIMNVVACEGLDRVERPSSYRSWGSRAQRAGFRSLPVSDWAVAKVKEAWRLYEYNDKLRMGKDEDWLLLGWKNCIMFGLSLWEPTKRPTK